MKAFLKNMFSNSSDVSSKRVMGIIGALNLYVHTWLSPITGDDLITHCALIGGLLGIGAIVDIVGNLNKDKDNEK